MDDVGRSCRLILIFAAAAAVMGFFTLCANALLNLDENEFDGYGENDKRAGKIKKLLQSPEKITAANLSVRTLVIVMLSGAFGKTALSCFESLSERLLPKAWHLVGTAVLACLFSGLCALLISAIAVNVPKRLVLSGRVPSRFAYKVFPVYKAFLVLSAPLRILSLGISNLLVALFGVRKENEKTAVSADELVKLVSVAAADETADIEDGQAEMISNIFEFSDTELHEIMTHRTEICAVELSAKISDVVKEATESGVSRVPVYQNSIDNIVGVIYVKDLLPIILQPEKAQAGVGEYMHGIKYVPESGGCSELFRYFNENKKQIAVVLDEYGGTAGIVTMEDLLECIVGNIRDEYDENEAEEIEEITPHTFDILGSADPDEVMEKLGEKLPEDGEYDTMGGFVTELLGFIPEDGQTPNVRYKSVTFAVISAKDNRIEKLRAVKDRKKAAVLDDE